MMAPLLRNGPMRATSPAICDKGVQSTTNSAPWTASLRSCVTTSAISNFLHSASADSRRTHARTLAASRRFRMARAREPPINPAPIILMQFQRMLNWPIT